MIMRRVRRNGRWGLRSVRAGRVRPGDFELAPAGSNAHEVTVYSIGAEMTRRSLGLAWQQFPSTAAGRRALVSDLDDEGRVSRLF